MLATLPSFSRGLKLVRVGVFIMLLQLVILIIARIKLITADNQESARSALAWTEYYLLANATAMIVMFVGAARAIPELKRTAVGAGQLVVAAIGFAIAAAAVLWTYKVLSTFVDIALNIDKHSLEELTDAAKDLETLRYVIILQDPAYAVGLIALIGMVRASAIANDQLALRDVAGSMRRALIVMLAGDVFWQVTYGLGPTIDVLGLIASLLVAGFWIFVHVKLQRFLYNAAYFMNEPHNLPLAKALVAPELGAKPAKKKPAAPARPSVPRMPPAAAQPQAPRPAVELPARPSQPRAEPPRAEPPCAEPPRAASPSEGEPKAGEPRFLR